ncbi:MAG: M23 family metallopeptidase [Candidatus Sungbacteria bacterium]|uniref:M23 family metallopeptidase n=1 Tax=Candidatus Sungiibacteriota bacterium TaxID=2750080 RepID=A0A932YWR2_9BACT|nr:M23 family metallopeptidase [Candidatus Sungbacteria bacterium]
MLNIAVPVFGVALLLALTPRSSEAGILSMLLKFFSPAPIEIEEKSSVFIPEIRAAAGASALNAANRPPASPDDPSDESPINVIQDNALLAPLNPLGTLAPDNRSGGQIFVYTIRSGDTLSAIAKSFDVSINTILWANSITDIRALKTGDQLIILPVTGVQHEVQKGDTIASIAKKYRASTDDVLQYNGLAPDERLAPGSIVIVPNGELSVPVTPSAPRQTYFANLPLYEGYYIRPILGGRRSRGIHGYNGVDLADSCGLPVLASAEGQVIIARSSGWNGGYGRYLVISHPNATQTLYAHLRELSVQAGAAVRQGELVGLIGSSGNSTGCHVHFEIRGARNPF